MEGYRPAHHITSFASAVCPAVGLITFGEKTRIPIAVQRAEFQAFAVLPLRCALVQVRLVICNDDAPSAVSAKMRFPLPPGATVCRFTFDRNGKTYPAVPVPKAKAQSVVYAEKEKGRDVAATREVQANVFEMEVFPLLPKTQQTCELLILQPLAAAADGDCQILNLPFRFPNPVMVSCDMQSFPAIEWTTSLERQKVFSSLCEGIVCRGFSSHVSLGDAVLGDAFGAKHFVWRIPACKVSELLGPAPPASTVGEHIAVILDTSGSAEATDHMVIIALLQMLEERWVSDDVCLIMSLWTFSMGTPKHRVKRGTVRDVCDAVAAVCYDGGTDLKECLDEIVGHLASMDDLHCALLFSDGIDSLGRRPDLCTYALSGPKLRVPMHCIVTSQPSDIPLLRMIAHSTGGLCFADKFILEDVCTSILVAGAASPSVSKLEALVAGKAVLTDQCNDFESVPDHRLPQIIWPVEEDGVVIAGRLGNLAVDELKITLVAAGGRQAQHTLNLTEAHVLPPDHARIAGWSYSIQAFKQYQLLGLPHEATRRHLEDLSATYGLASQVTDLLLLYEVAQFSEHGIHCPTDHPAHKEWLSMRSVIEDRDNGTDPITATDTATDLIGASKNGGEIEMVLQLGVRLHNFLADPKSFCAGGGAGVRGCCEEEDEDDMDFDLFDGGPAAPRASSRESVSAEAYGGFHSSGVAEEVYAERSISPLAPGSARAASQAEAAPEASTVVDSGTVDKVVDCEAYVHGSEASYLVPLRASLQDGRWEEEYFKLKKQHGKSPSFYVFAAQLLHNTPVDVCEDAAVRVLSNCLELDLQEVQLLRTVGYGLFAYGKPGCAIALFDRVAVLANSEPQSYLDAALARVQLCAGRNHVAMRPAIETGLQEAANSLAIVLQRRWASRFAEVEWPALVLLNALQSLLVPTEEIANDPPKNLSAWLEKADLMHLHITKTDLAEKLGVSTVSESGVARRIKIVTAGGLIHNWNKNSTSLLVEEGDLIVDVNGVGHDSERISADLKESVSLKVTLAKNYVRHSANAPLLEPLSFWPPGLDERLRINGGMKVGLLIWMSWDTDHTDVDLHVQEPSGNVVYYSNNRSQIGGLLSRDFTNGYGPEVYLLPVAPCGEYTVRAKYYASHQASRATGTTSVVLWSFAHLGSPHCASMDFRVVRLQHGSEKMDVLHVELPDGIYRATKTATIFASTRSSKSIGKLFPGQVVCAAGACEVVDGFSMLPIKPEGAVQMTFLGPGPPVFKSGVKQPMSEQPAFEQREDSEDSIDFDLFG